MKDFKNGAATPKLELSSKSRFWESSPFVYALRKPLEEISSETAGMDVLVVALEERAGALHTKRKQRPILKDR